jgi:probable rRNA maturation factor
VETAQREAEEAGLGFEERFDRLLIHGILHLLGYDHERPGSDARAGNARTMEAKEEELMALLAQEEDRSVAPGR